MTTLLTWSRALRTEVSSAGGFARWVGRPAGDTAIRSIKVFSPNSRTKATQAAASKKGGAADTSHSA